MKNLTGKRIRTNIDDFDLDPEGNERGIPAGTLGTIVHGGDGLYDIAWDNGAWTRWTQLEVDRDAILTGDADPGDVARFQQELGAGPDEVSHE